ncbi:MAG: YbhB/YbcL family Raf kinase inhibitor-like protein [Gammaproteobacteria bacterium]|jgi:Raf kinase inhibitor-like YbhB/YbcL family protein|nr:YbhB/YbcL family Raf kinase inhibitor-like protein [Gammaproteobacteria bacterium]|tara:strand:+ start:162 stop:737 length:576 start_codon:yes stop_codon:yes gene_type:complete
MKKYYSNVAVLLLSCLALQVNAQDAPETVTITSSAFDHHGMVPEVNSAYGDNVSIDLSWSDLPAGTQQLALICDDPEVVEIGMMEQPFVHWVMYNIPASASGLPAGLPSDTELSIDGLEGAVNGLNGLRRPGYFGPRPPANGHLHAYHFRIYALDDELDLDSGLGKDELLAEMEGHVLATGMLMGHYERKE